MRRHLGIILIPMLLGSIAGCSSDDSPTAPAGPSRAVQTNPSFAADIQEIFDRRGCSGSSCHGSSQSAGLDLRAANSHGELVGIRATQSSLNRVERSDASKSYLILKLEGNQTTGNQMPPGGPVINATDLQNIKNWINQGALDN